GLGDRGYPSVTRLHKVLMPLARSLGDMNRVAAPQEGIRDYLARILIGTIAIAHRAKGRPSVRRALGKWLTQPAVQGSARDVVAAAVVWHLNEIRRRKHAAPLCVVGGLVEALWTDISREQDRLTVEVRPLNERSLV